MLGTNYVGQAYPGQDYPISGSVERSSQETVVLSESFLKKVDTLFAEAVALTEARVFAISRTFAEAVGLAEGFAAVKTMVRTLTDTLGVTEAFTKSIAKQQAETVVLTEQLQTNMILGGTPGIGPWNAYQQFVIVAMPTTVFPRK
jgi:hypothetical protein